MKNFWTNFFAFLIILLLLLWAYDPRFIQGAVVFLGAWFMLLLYIVLVGVVGALLITAWLLYRKQELASNRPVDGAYPLQRIKTRDGRQLIINPGHMVGAAAVIDRRAGTYVEVEHPAGWDVVANVRQAVERSNTVRAMFPGDAARMNANGAMSPMPRVPNFKQLEARPPQPPPRIIGAEPPPVERPQPQAIALPDAIRTNTQKSFAIGQDRDSGALVRWDVAQYPHARFHGASQGSGKTNAAKTALVGMALQDAHVVILDRRRFKDFADFNGKAELIDTSNPATFVEVMRRLELIYRERDRLLGAHGAANIDELPQRPVRYVVMLTEFGTLCSVADGEGLLRDAMRPLANIMREAGAAGIHLVFEDQVVEKGKWPRGVAANASGVFTGHLPLNMGAAGGYHHAHQLGMYEFHHDGQIFRTWDMKAATRRLLASAPMLDPRLVVLDGVATPVGDGERSGVQGSALDLGPTPVNDGMNAPMNNAGEQWDDVVIAWFAANPQALTGPPVGISDLARAMAASEGNSRPHTAYKGLAHKLFHAFRKNVRLPSGDPLGVDVTIDQR